MKVIQKIGLNTQNTILLSKSIIFSVLCHNYLFYFWRYTRNLIDKGNGKFNLILLCWAESQGSSIHDHSNSHCFVKILDGELTETLYEWPKYNCENECLKPVKVTTCYKNEATYINGKFFTLLNFVSFKKIWFLIRFNRITSRRKSITHKTSNFITRLCTTIRWVSNIRWKNFEKTQLQSYIF
jgi:hypothetical protein